MITGDENGEGGKRRGSWPGSPSRFSESMKWLLFLFPAVVAGVVFLLMVLRAWVVGG